MNSETKPANYNSKFLAGGLLHPGRRPALFFCLLTLALLLVSAVAHFCTYATVNISRDFPWLWLALHLSILIHFAIHWRYKRRPTFKGPAAYVEEPLVVVFLLAVLIGFALFYAMINFAYYYWVLRYGYPDQVGGQFLLILPRGETLKLSPDQFSLDELYQARKVSGHWMLCHLMALNGYYDWLTDRVV